MTARISWLILVGVFFTPAYASAQAWWNDATGQIALDRYIGETATWTFAANGPEVDIEQLSPEQQPRSSKKGTISLCLQSKNKWTAEQVIKFDESAEYVLNIFQPSADGIYLVEPISKRVSIVSGSIANYVADLLPCLPELFVWNAIYGQADIKWILYTTEQSELATLLTYYQDPGPGLIPEEVKRDSWFNEVFVHELPQIKVMLDSVGRVALMVYKKGDVILQKAEYAWEGETISVPARVVLQEWSFQGDLQSRVEWELEMTSKLSTEHVFSYKFQPGYLVVDQRGDEPIYFQSKILVPED